MKLLRNRYKLSKLLNASYLKTIIGQMQTSSLYQNFQSSNLNNEELGSIVSTNIPYKIIKNYDHTNLEAH